MEVGSSAALEIKQQLADAVRMLARAEIVDHSGHGSARRDNRSFYINSGASTRGTLAADDIVAVDFDGALVEGGARPPLEFYLHAEIYRARADVHAIMHTHPRWSTLLTMVGAGYQVVCSRTSASSIRRCRSARGTWARRSRRRSAAARPCC